MVYVWFLCQIQYRTMFRMRPESQTYTVASAPVGTGSFFMIICGTEWDKKEKVLHLHRKACFSFCCKKSPQFYKQLNPFFQFHSLLDKKWLGPAFHTTAVYFFN